jgi:hypothetical protein
MNGPLGMRHDLLAITSADTPLVRTSGTRGGEYHGPCPLCGGRDRFFVQPNHDGGFWFCRRCRPKGGDVIGYIMARERVSYRQACALLSGDALQEGTPPRPAPPLRPAGPDDAWRAHGMRLIADWEDCLWAPAGARALAWLYGRGLGASTILQARLGYCAADGTHGAWYLHRGITIPLWGVDGALHGIRIRRPVPRDAHVRNKYLSIRGSSGTVLYGGLHGADTLLITEGYFDCLLAAQELEGHAVDVATMNLCRPEGSWLRYLLRYRRILVALDADGAGDDGWGRWAWIGTARRASLPDGAKDITQAVVDHTVDLAGWVAEQVGTMEPPVPLAQAAPIVHAEPEEATPRPSPDRVSILPCEARRPYDAWLDGGDEGAF